MLLNFRHPGELVKRGLTITFGSRGHVHLIWWNGGSVRWCKRLRYAPSGLPGTPWVKTERGRTSFVGEQHRTMTERG